MRTVPLRHVADVRTSSVDKHTHEGEVPVQLCNYVDVYKNDTVRPGPGLMRATATRDEVTRFRLEVGDSVLTKDSEDPRDIGISAYIDGTADDFVCGYHLAIARPLLGTHPRYLTWALRTRPVLDHFTNHASGISRYGLTTAGVRAAPLPWHSETGQRRVADFLDDRVARIDQVIAARLAQISALEAAYVAWLGEFVDALGRKHGWAPLRRFDVSVEQGWSPEADSVPAMPGQPGILKLGAVRAGIFEPQQNKAFLDGVTPREEWRVVDGDLLVTRANTPSLVGDAAVAENVNVAVYLSDLIYRLRTSTYGAHLASTALRSPRSRQLIGVIARGTSGSMPKLRGEDILALPVPTVPLEDHAGLGKEDKAQRGERDRRTSHLRHMVERLTEYKQSLITAAVTGELDVTTAGSGIPG